MNAIKRTNWLALALWCTGISIVWCLLLPAWTRQSENANWLNRLDQHGINPSAMFYTEQELIGINSISQ